MVLFVTIAIKDPVPKKNESWFKIANMEKKFLHGKGVLHQLMKVKAGVGIFPQYSVVSIKTTKFTTKKTLNTCYIQYSL